MITVLIPVRDEVEALAGLLTALVPAAVDGLVKDVVVADAGSTEAVARLCEDAGALLVRGSIAAAAARGRGQWLLALAPESRLFPGWREAVAEHVAHARAPALVLGPPAGRWLADRRRDRAAGLLIRVCDFAGAQGDLADLRRRFSRAAVRLG